MNKEQKNTFYKFLFLYLFSSYILLGTIAYIYYESQKQLIHVDIHFKLHERSNKIHNKLNNILKKQKKLNIENLYKNFNTNEYQIELIDKHAKTINKNPIKYPKKILNTGSFDIGHACLLVRKNSLVDDKSEIWGYIITDKLLSNKEDELKNNIIILFTSITILIAILGYFLSKLFLKPINEHIKNLNNFIKDVNHELNTPITSLMISSKELDKNFNKRLVKSVIISTKQLYEIYQTLIDINFNLKSKVEKLDLKDSLNQSIEYFSEILISKNIVIQSDLHTAIFYANKEKIQRIFNNLISNAIKYSYPNSIIKIELKNNILKIIDHGIGISKDKQEKVFERFYKQSIQNTGFGIGLDVIKKISQEYDIKITLESIPNKYTCFILDFNKI